VNDYTEVAIVAAMEREVQPLVRDWPMILSHSRRMFEKGHVIFVCAGIGENAARKATESILTFRAPQVILSVGLAGALDETLSVGTLVVPTKVLRQQSGRAFTIEGGEGTLLTATDIVNPDEKRKLAKQFGAQAIDMEAAAVAEVAQERGVRFVAVKAISDDLDFPMPPLGRFIDSGGHFHAARFAAHAAIRPSMWPVLSQLRSNAGKASRALCEALAQIKSAEDVEQLLHGRAQAS
jgi:adenosylhomocysteine nucleosidase